MHGSVSLSCSWSQRYCADRVVQPGGGYEGPLTFGGVMQGQPNNKYSATLAVNNG